MKTHSIKIILSFFRIQGNNKFDIYQFFFIKQYRVIHVISTQNEGMKKYILNVVDHTS